MIYFQNWRSYEPLKFHFLSKNKILSELKIGIKSSEKYDICVDLVRQIKKFLLIESLFQELT